MLHPELLNNYLKLMCHALMCPLCYMTTTMTTTNAVTFILPVHSEKNQLYHYTLCLQMCPFKILMF